MKVWRQIVGQKYDLVPLNKDKILPGGFKHFSTPTQSAAGVEAECLVTGQGKEGKS